MINSFSKTVSIMLDLSGACSVAKTDEGTGGGVGGSSTCLTIFYLVQHLAALPGGWKISLTKRLLFNFIYSKLVSAQLNLELCSLDKI